MTKAAYLSWHHSLFWNVYKDIAADALYHCFKLQPSITNKQTWQYVQEAMFLPHLIIPRNIPITTRCCLLWLVTYRRYFHGFKMCLERGFHTLLRNVSFPSPTGVRSHNPPPWNPASSLAHRIVSDSNIIWNSSNPSLADIVWFVSLRIVISLTVLEPVY